MNSDYERLNEKLERGEARPRMVKIGQISSCCRPIHLLTIRRLTIW